MSYRCLRQISINTYIALGMTLIIILGHIDLSVGSIVAMSGTLTVGFIVNQGLPLGVAIAAGLFWCRRSGWLCKWFYSSPISRCLHSSSQCAMMNIASGLAYVYTVTVNTYHKQTLSSRSVQDICSMQSLLRCSVHGSLIILFSFMPK